MTNALYNLATVMDEDCTTLASITAALASSNTKMASPKRKLKSQSNPTEKKIQAWELLLDTQFFLWEGAHQCILQVAKVRKPKRGNQAKQNWREQKI